jgi:threonine dehydrogenase-like Zn-dependent dehydrogenase
MRCAVFKGAGRKLAIEDVAMPVPQAGEALIRVERCGICASDMHMTSGSSFDVPLGTALGHEYAGEVVALPPGDNRLALGDRVTALPMWSCGHCAACRADQPLHCPQFHSMQGAYGEYVLINQNLAMRLPASLSFADGALVEPLSSALHGVRKLDLPRGATVAVIGAGAIGAAAVFWSRLAGAGRIVAIAPSRRGEALTASVGADGFATLGEGLADRVAEALGGPPDVVIEAAGARGALQQAVELVRVGGAILSLGGCVQHDAILPVLAMVKDITIRFSAAYGASDFRHAIDTLDSGACEPRAMIGDTIGLDAFPDRFEAMRTGSHPAKVMVAPRQG